MKKMTYWILVFSFVCVGVISGVNTINPKVGAPSDPTHHAELDDYYTTLSKTVAEGDFDGYAALYHEDAVVIFAGGENKVSMPISKALARWKQGFEDTKAGKQKDSVVFRFSQRIHDESSAHDTGIFHFTSFDSDGNEKANIMVHFEMLLVRRDGVWLSTMEYQKSGASQEEWDALDLN